MRFDLLVIGATPAYTHLLPQLLSSLPADFPLPVAAVQHRLLGDEGVLAHFLQRSSRLRVVEAEDKQPLRAGCIYLAPADYHLLIENGHCALSTEGPVWLVRPSIDVLFESAADAYGRRLVAVLLADGKRNQDGMYGLVAIRNAGGLIFGPTPAGKPDEASENMLLLAEGMSQLLPPAAIGLFLHQRLSTIEEQHEW